MGILFLAKVVIQSLMLLLALFGVAGAKPVDPRQLDIKTGHPILFVNPQIVANAKNKKTLLNDFVKNEARRHYLKADTLDVPLIRQHADERTVGGQHEGYYVDNLALPYGLYALLTEDPIGIEYCRQILLSFIDMGVAWHGPGDGHNTGKLFAMGLLYDWIHPHLSPDIRRSVREHLLASMEFLDTNKHGYLLLNPSRFLGTHAHYTNIYALVALLAIRHDIVLDSKTKQDRYFYLLGKVVSNWIEGYNKTYAWVSQGGGHHMGWAYGQSFTRSLPYLAWEYATNEPPWLTNWQNDRTFFYLYGLRKLSTIGYDMYPVAGDSFGANWGPARAGLEVTVSASHFNNPYAAWLTKRLGASYFAKLLYEPDASSVSTPPVALPLARYFPNSGYVIMRDTWNFDDNTLMVFHLSSFYTFNHGHRDQNAFTIFYKGPLAIDSGAYSAGGAYDSNHWYNYYTRSVAHNTILVYDPNENNRDHITGAVISRDGGQRVLANIEPTYDEMREGGVHHFDGILRYENHAEYAYSMGDATKAYSSNKLSEFKRSVVYLRNHSYNHPLILVYDRVVSTHPGFKKTYLLHSINRPKVKGKVVQIAIEDAVDPKSLGGLFQETLLPANPVLTVIGGRSNNQDFYVHDDGFGVPRNYNKGVLYDTTTPHLVKGLREAGEWRVEISPSAPSRDDTFLNVISVTDDPSNHAQAVVQTVGSAKIDGAVVNDRDGMEKCLVLFQKEPGPLLEEIDLLGRNSFDTILIVGLAPNTTYSISNAKDVLSIQDDPAGNAVSSKQGTIYDDAIKLGPNFDDRPPKAPRDLRLR